MLQLLISCLLGTFFSGLASVLNLLCSFLLLKVDSFLLSLYEELLSTMFERLLGSSGIVAGEVVPLLVTAFLSAWLILQEPPQIGRHKHAEVEVHSGQVPLRGTLGVKSALFEGDHAL